MRWKLSVNKDSYELTCKYGISKGGTPGFIDEKVVHGAGKLTKERHIYTLHRNNQTLELLEINENLLHLADHHSNMLVGNGGYSFVLNNDRPKATQSFTIAPSPNKQAYPLVFEGRTPCQGLSHLLDPNKQDACLKMKWYVLLYADPITQKPTYYLEGGSGYRKETMDKGTWSIQTLSNGRIIYQLKPDNKDHVISLLKGDDNILFFVRPDGSLLVGNEDFSYTLNRRSREYDRVTR